MAAFCACCGAEITRKVEACPVCGTPRHGMLPLELEPHQEAGKGRSEEKAKNPRRLGDL
jgi:predicted amidophosphoribosyltransferase